MKKAVTIFLFICLFISNCCIAQAEDFNPIDFSSLNNNALISIYGKVKTELAKRAIANTSPKADINAPILFRDIPWGTSATAFKKAMSKQKSKGSISDAYYCETWEYREANGTITPRDTMESAGFEYHDYSPNIQVASFKLSKIEASFLFSHDDAGVYTKEDKSSLYKATYTFDVKDGTAAYDILIAKLTELYGTGTNGTNSTGWWSSDRDYHTNTDWTVWYGTENTGVVLWHEYETFDDDGSVKADTVFLSYGKTDSIQLFSALKAAQAREEMKDVLNSGSFDGL